MEVVPKDANTSTSIQNDFMLPNNVKNHIRIEDNKIRYTDDQIDKDLLKPFKYVLSTPGKNLRETFIEAVNYWLQCPEDKLTLIADIINNCHHVSLLMDDIQDSSFLRRGVPAAHTIYGIVNTMNTVSFVTNFTIGEQLLSLNHPEAEGLVSAAALEACRGQGMELYWRDRCVCPTEDEYIQMVVRKTSSIFKLGVNLLQLCSKTSKDFLKVTDIVGLYFQILDDYNNLSNPRYFDLKGFCEDITEGKFSFLVVHAVNSHPKNGRMIMEILSQRTQDIKRKKQLLSLLDECGSFEYTRNKLKELKNFIFEDVQRLGGNPFMENLLKKIDGEELLNIKLF